MQEQMPENSDTPENSYVQSSLGEIVAQDDEWVTLQNTDPFGDQFRIRIPRRTGFLALDEAADRYEQERRNEQQS